MKGSMKYTRGTRGNEEKEFVIQKALMEYGGLEEISPQTLAQESHLLSMHKTLRSL